MADGDAQAVLSGGGAHHEKLMHRAIDVVCQRPPRNLDAGLCVRARAHAPGIAARQGSLAQSIAGCPMAPREMPPAAAAVCVPNVVV